MALTKQTNGKRHRIDPLANIYKIITQFKLNENKQAGGNGIFQWLSLIATRGKVFGETCCRVKADRSET